MSKLFRGECENVLSASLFNSTCNLFAFNANVEKTKLDLKNIQTDYIFACSF